MFVFTKRLQRGTENNKAGLQLCVFAVLCEYKDCIYLYIWSTENIWDVKIKLKELIDYTIASNIKITRDRLPQNGEFDTRVTLQIVNLSDIRGMGIENIQMSFQYKYHVNIIWLNVSCAWSTCVTTSDICMKRFTDNILLHCIIYHFMVCQPHVVFNIAANSTTGDCFHQLIIYSTTYHIRYNCDDRLHHRHTINMIYLTGIYIRNAF